jgi:hypothetical protein
MLLLFFGLLCQTKRQKLGTEYEVLPFVLLLEEKTQFDSFVTKTLCCLSYAPIYSYYFKIAQFKILAAFSISTEQMVLN